MTTHWLTNARPHLPPVTHDTRYHDRLRVTWAEEVRTVVVARVCVDIYLVGAFFLTSLASLPPLD